MNFVLDASVYIARHSPKETHHQRAKQLWQLAPTVPFHVPEIFALEVVAAFARLGLSSDLIDEHHAFMMGAKFIVHPVDKGLVDGAMVVARDGRTRSADAIYMALAMRLQAVFLTLDLKLRTHLADSTNMALRDLNIQS